MVSAISPFEYVTILVSIIHAAYISASKNTFMDTDKI